MQCDWHTVVSYIASPLSCRGVTRKKRINKLVVIVYRFLLIYQVGNMLTVLMCIRTFFFSQNRRKKVDEKSVHSDEWKITPKKKFKNRGARYFLIVCGGWRVVAGSYIELKNIMDCVRAHFRQISIRNNRTVANRP